MEKLTVPYVAFKQQVAAIKKELMKAVESVLESGQYVLSEKGKKFEKEFSEYCDTKFSTGVANGTCALHLVLRCLDIGPGDEVITAPNSFIASAGAIGVLGAIPVFADICPDLNLDPAQLEKAITSKTKAIMPVHLTGRPAKMKQILEIADHHKISVIEDAAQAIGASLDGKRVGGIGDAACFSLHPLKNFHAFGDGGMVTTNRQEVYEKIIVARNHGLKNRDECSIFAYNSRLDSIQAIVANHLLKQIDYITDSRIKNAAEYDQQLSKIPQITIPNRSKYEKQVYHIYVVRAERRNELKKYLNQNGVDAKVHYPIPMHLQPAAKQYGYKKGDFPVSETVCDQVISLPVHEFVTNEQIDYTVTKIREFYAHS